ncbi:MAG TPA: hypothetical protein VFF52_25580 [Isosphaeraceae bacterium]|nr:hypothetical protein [Isosphaeraceae bacterium]
MRHHRRAALVASALACLGTGCGSGSDRRTPAATAIPSPNRRILANEKLKELIGKDGKPIWTPGKPMRPPK